MESQRPDAPADPAPPTGGDPPSNAGGQVVELKRTEKETVFALMPTRAYVEARSVRYRTLCLVAILATGVACLVHWLVRRPDTPDAYVIAVALAALAMALALKTWNATIRAGIVLTVGRRVRFRIATIKLTVHPMLGEKLGLARSANGRLWNICHVDRGRPRLKFRLAVEAFPGLPAFFNQTLPDAWQDMREADDEGSGSQADVVNGDVRDA